MKVSVVLPVSRAMHLPRIFAALELMDCDRKQTSLVTYVDAGNEVFALAKKLTDASKFSTKICVQRRSDSQPRYDLRARRIRIAEIHNAIRALVPDCDYVFGLEDDSVPRGDALQRLLRDYASHPFAGLISGVQIGRHGLSHLGLWSVDDVYEPTTITSLMPGRGVQEIDASGMYTFLTKRDNYVKHDFKPFGNNDLGPDVQWTLALRQAGYRNYADFSVPVEHRCDDGTSLTLANTQVLQVRLAKTDGAWTHQVLS